MLPLPKTVFVLNWSEGSTTQTRYFPVESVNKAAYAFAERINTANASSETAAFVTLSRLPDSVYPDGITLISWTKMDNLQHKDEASETYYMGETDLAKALY